MSPSASTDCATKDFTEFGSVTSRWNPTASPPSALILPTMSLSFSTRRAPRATGKPGPRGLGGGAPPNPGGGPSHYRRPPFGQGVEAGHSADLHAHWQM